jgi:YgiT-type zinc finger domain-containing protein
MICPISTTDLSIANIIAHGEGIPGLTLTIHCENCGGQLFQIVDSREKKGNRNQDIVIEKVFFLKCQRCGSEQCEHALTIVPSWSGVNIDRDTLPVWEEEP